MEKKNSMVNVTIATNMVTKANECKEKPKFEGKCHKCKKQGHKASDCRTKSFNPIEKIAKEIFG